MFSEEKETNSVSKVLSESNQFFSSPEINYMCVSSANVNRTVLRVSADTGDPNQNVRGGESCVSLRVIEGKSRWDGGG